MRRARPSVFERIPTTTRAWASRLLLLLACASVVATSQPQSDDVASEVLTGAPIRLTTEAPRVTRTVVVRTSAKENVPNAVEGELRVQAKATWTPSDPAQTTRPWLAIHIDGQTRQGGTSGVLESGVAVTVENIGGLGDFCRQNQGCEWTQQVSFELQANAVPGTVDVEWTAQAFAHVLDDTSIPKGFTVTVSEP